MNINKEQNVSEEKPVFIVGRHPHSKPWRANSTFLLQAIALGYLKMGNKCVEVIDIHELSSGTQIEIDN